jgi:serine/threonine protein kinase
MDSFDHSEVLKPALDSAEIIETTVCPTCGIKLSSELSICPNDKTVLIKGNPLGSKLTEQYEILGEIGSGGMGVIFKARHMALGQLVAIKMLHLSRLDTVGLERFAQEAKAVNLLDHPGIVHIRDYGLTEFNQPYMVLDYIEASTLEETMSFQGALDVPYSLDIFAQIADAIGHAHERGILHRDLKPSNIMLVKTDEQSAIVKIVDFGIAKITDQYNPAQAQLTKTGEVFGSPLYMSPEQATGAKVDQRSDIYSLGCVMFETLTGVPPFSGKGAIQIISSQMNCEAPTLKEGSKGKVFPKNVEEIVSKALRKNPDERFQSMQELKEALVIARFDDKKSIEKLSDDQIAGAKNIKVQALLLKAALLALVGTLCIVVYFGWQQFHVGKSIGRSPEFVSIAPTDLETIQSIQKAGALSQSEINLSGNITDAALVGFDSCLNTKKVAITATPIKGRGLAHLIHLPLTELDLQDSDVTDRGLKEIGYMTLLKELNLENTKITGEGLSSLSSLKNLTDLHLNDDKVSAKGLHYLVALPVLKDLTLNRVECDWPAALAELAQFPALQTLSLQFTRISNDDLAAMKNLKKLVSLNLDFTEISEQGIANLANHPTLQVLSLQGCKHFNGSNFKIFAKLHLSFLDFRNIEINENALQNLEQTSIGGLNLSQSQITDRGLAILSRNRKITWLVVVSCHKLTKPAIASFMKQRPDCNLEH